MPTSMMTMAATMSEARRSETVVQHRVHGELSGWDNQRVAPSGQRLLRVLIIGDDAETMELLCRMVGDWGHEVRWAYDACGGLRIAERYHPHLLLLDVAKRQVDGGELPGELRGDARLKECLVIAVTDQDEKAHRLRCRQAGIDVVLVKPVDPVMLESLLTLESEYVKRL